MNTRFPLALHIVENPNPVVLFDGAALIFVANGFPDSAR
jgi:hypothetical protein